MAPITMAGATALAGGLSAGSSIGNSLIGGNLNRKNRKFNAEQAQLNRDFQAQQADIARSWQESFYNQYQSPSALMRQANEAGIHPYAALGLNPASGPSGTSIPGGSQASAPPPQFQGLADISGTILSLMRLKSEIDNIEADTENKRSQSGLYNSQISLNSQQIDKLKSDISLNAENAKTEIAKQSLYSADAVLKNDEHALFDAKKNQFNLNNFLLEWKKEYIKRYHHSPDQNALTILLDKFKPITDVGEVLLEDIGNIAGSSYSLLKSLVFGE